MPARRSGDKPVAACTSADLHLVLATTGGFTAGQYFATLRATGTSPRKCLLQGWAGLKLYDTSHRPMAIRVLHKGPQHEALVDERSPVEWDLLWSQVPGASPCTPLVTTGSIHVIVGGVQPIVVAATPASANNSGPPALCARVVNTVYESSYGTHAF